MTRRLLWLGAYLLAGCHGKYIRAVTGEPIAATPARLQRGSYLVNHVMACGACHATREDGNILTQAERAGAPLGGGNLYTDKTLGMLWIPNLTVDAETGLGRWKDDEVLRALRDGVLPNGELMIPLMPYRSYHHLSDEDGRAVVVYLRSLPAYHQPKPRQANNVAFMPRMLFKVIGVQMQPPSADVTAPDPTDKLQYGRYLARLGGCADCHSLTERGPRPENDPLFFAGSSVPFEDPALGSTYARNLTPDPDSGLGNYDAASVMQALRAGRRLDGKTMAPPMSLLTPHLAGLTDGDLAALVAFLKSLPPIRNRVPDRVLTAALRRDLGD